MARVLLSLGLFFLLAALSCAQLPSPTAPASALPDPPLQDFYDLARRLRLHNELDPPRHLPALPPLEIGHRLTFSAVNLETEGRFSVTAVLRLVSDHAYFYVEEGHEVALAKLEAAAREFEERIYPRVTRYFGERLELSQPFTILNATIPGAAGYYSAVDEYPKVVYPYSNERVMIYMNLAAVEPGSPAYGQVLAHELGHLLQGQESPGRQTWLNEGLAELAANLAGYEPAFLAAFTAAPATQLTTWKDETRENAAHYGAAYLFAKYLTQHYGGYLSIKELRQAPGFGTKAIEAYLAKKGYSKSFDSVFKDWVIANYVDDPQGGPYSYADEEVRLSPQQRITDFHQSSGTVPQYAAQYVEIDLKESAAKVSFQGGETVKLLPTTPHSGSYLWWSHRGDAINTTLTRQFDLSPLSRATARFWLWYDLEEHWDYVYIEASRDGGRTWDILSGAHTTPRDPLVNSFGPGYTGRSGGGKEPVWLEETLDLSAYAGGKILLRFECVTDEAVNNNGFALDDLHIPELSFEDDAEQDQGWTAQGFLRTNNLLKQQFIVQVIEVGPAVKVREMALDRRNQGSLGLTGFGSALRKAILIVATTTPWTTEEAFFRFAVSSRSP